MVDFDWTKDFLFDPNFSGEVVLMGVKRVLEEVRSRSRLDSYIVINSLLLRSTNVLLGSLLGSSNKVWNEIEEGNQALESWCKQYDRVKFWNDTSLFVD